MLYLLGILLAHALTYGATQKLAPLLESNLLKIPFFDFLFSCPYCMGFHCGWISWWMLWGATGEQLLVGPGVVGLPWLPLLCWSFLCAGTSYVLEMAVSYLEKNQP